MNKSPHLQTQSPSSEGATAVSARPDLEPRAFTDDEELARLESSSEAFQSLAFPPNPPPSELPSIQRQQSQSSGCGHSFGQIQIYPTPLPLIQLSRLSNELETIWRMQGKGAFFNRLRQVQVCDEDVSAFVAQNLQGDDLWLAQTILRHGPEPLWPRAAFEERQRRATANGWPVESRPSAASLGVTEQGELVMAYFFAGTSSERALIVSGVHGSELSGIEVAETLLRELQSGPRPYYSVILVPRLFPDNAAVAEADPDSIGSTANVGRHTHGNSVDPNRQFPQLGRAFDADNPVDARGRAIEPENVMLLDLIQRFQPSRIASLHAVRSESVAGIFADPRTDHRGRALGYDDDRQLALEMAWHAHQQGANVPANQFNASSSDDNITRSQHNAVYPRDPQPVSAGQVQPRETTKGISLGGWGSQEVRDRQHPEHNRAAMTVITVEVQTAHRSSDVEDSASAARLREIEAHSDALRDIFLGPPSRSP